VDLARILFCDYDGEFEYSDVLSRLGYLVDQIRPDSLRAVTVGEHQLYLLSFGELESCKKALRVCEKLKQAELQTPIMLVYRSGSDPSFLNHQSSPQAADAYILNPSSEAAILDAIEDQIGLPPLRFVRDPSQLESEQKLQSYEQKIQALEAEMLELKGAATSLDKALEAQRNFYKPRLKALLEGQKSEGQTETEKLRIRLSEVEAKLLDREAKCKELEQNRATSEMKIEKIMSSHQKAQESLRQFYQEKIKKLEIKVNGT